MTKPKMKTSPTMSNPINSIIKKKAIVNNLQICLPAETIQILHHIKKETHQPMKWIVDTAIRNHYKK
jgi:hypothetical protein